MQMKKEQKERGLLYLGNSSKDFFKASLKMKKIANSWMSHQLSFKIKAYTASV